MKRYYLLLLVLCAMIGLPHPLVHGEVLEEAKIEWVSDSQLSFLELIKIEQSPQQLLLSVEGVDSGVEALEMDVWSSSDQSDKRALSFTATEDDKYQLVVLKEWARETTTLYARLRAREKKGTVVESKVIPLTWQEDLGETTNSLVNYTTRTTQAEGSTSQALSVTTVPATNATLTTTEVSGIATSQTTSASTQVVEEEENRLLPKAGLKITNHDLQKGTFEVVVSAISNPQSIRKIKIPVWTEENGQDDLRWYDGIRQANGDYKIKVDKKNHKNGQGTYHVHLYYENTAGKTVGLASTKTFLHVKGKIGFANVNSVTGRFDVVISSIESPIPVQKVKIPVWTEENGQDDLRWYETARQANGEYKVSIDKKNHKNGSGNYQVHLYYQYSASNQRGVAASKVSLQHKASGKVGITAINPKAGTFEVLVTGVQSTSPLKEVKIPVWTDKNGQDDIKWYTATKQTDGTYKVVVDKIHHKSETGLYHAHLYYTYGNGKTEGIASTKGTLLAPPISLRGTLETRDINRQTGSFDVVARVDSPTPIQTVQIAVWGEINGQNDLVWYPATRQLDGSYKVTVSQAKHMGEKGNYQLHLYVTTTDGKMSGLATKTEVMDYRFRMNKVVFLDPGHGGRDSGAYYSGIKEKDLVMNVTHLLKGKLEAAGYTVLLSRTGDYYVDFVTERSRLANASNADIFISLHFNASGVPNSSARGIETYWYESSTLYPPVINKAFHNDIDRLAKSSTLANAVHKGMVGQTKAVDRGVRRATFAVLRETAKPAILVEMGYMDNTQELASIKQASYQNYLATGIFKGIQSYYSTYQ